MLRLAVTRAFVALAVFLACPRSVAVAQAAPELGAPPELYDSTLGEAETPPNPTWLPQRTTDVAIGFGMTFVPRWGWADGGPPVGRLTSFDVAVVRRFGRRGTVRVALEPISIVRSSDYRSPLGRASVLGGARLDVARVYAGVSGWGLRGSDALDARQPSGGALVVGRVELGRPLGASWTLQGGAGLGSAFDSYAYSRSRRTGFTGEMVLQLPFPTRHRDVGAIRLVTRWFGAAGSLYGDAGLDVVVGHGPSTRRPVFVLGYRWTASWFGEGESGHGFRLGTEWYAVGGAPH